VCLGGFRNVRSDFDWEGFKLELDETRFEWGTVYEIEVETVRDWLGAAAHPVSVAGTAYAHALGAGLCTPTSCTWLRQWLCCRVTPQHAYGKCMNPSPRPGAVLNRAPPEGLGRGRSSRAGTSLHVKARGELCQPQALTVLALMVAAPAALVQCSV